MSTVSKIFLGTYNNPESEEFAQRYLELWHTKAEAVYVVGQMEVGIEGTPHIQFYLSFQKAKRVSALKKHCAKAHFESVKIDNGADRYCMKEETRVAGPWSYGHKPVQRHSKEDWDEVRRLAKTGQLDLIPPEIMIKHYSNLRQVAKDYQQNTSREVPR